MSRRSLLGHPLSCGDFALPAPMPGSTIRRVGAFDDGILGLAAHAGRRQAIRARARVASRDSFAKSDAPADLETVGAAARSLLRPPLLGRSLQCADRSDSDGRGRI